MPNTRKKLIKWYITKGGTFHITSNKEEALYPETMIEITADIDNMAYLFRMLNQEFTRLKAHIICNCSGEFTK